VDPEDPAAIEGAVRQLMEKPLLRKRCIQKGLKRVGKFTWERTAQLTLGVYEQVRAGIE
jgi:glycosyltransferase involved in cell wall biosynthesis